MKSRNTSIHKKGFTLIEILVAVGIFAVLIALGLSFSFSSYQGYIFRGDYTTLVQTLTMARNRSANNFDQSAHGVSFMANEYRLYAVNEYNPADSDTYQSFVIGDSLEINGTDEVIFEQLSGSLSSCDGNDPCELIVNGPTKSRTITINEYGGIIW